MNRDPKTWFSFTDRRLEKLQPTTKRAYYNDAQPLRGLQIVVQTSGVKTFYYRCKIEGKAHRIHIGRFPEVTVKEARKQAWQHANRLALADFDRRFPSLALHRP